MADAMRTKRWLLKPVRQIRRWLPNRPVTLRVRGLGPLRIRPRQHFYRWKALGRRYTPDLALRMYASQVRPGSVVYDIGANIGLYARYVAQTCEPQRLVLFEPMSENLELLRANIRLGGLEALATIYPLAVGDRDGEETLQVDNIQGGTATLDRLSKGRAATGRSSYNLPPLTETVRVCQLDTLVADEQLPPPDVIKIDNEGAETLVLNGGSKALQAHHPVLVIALHGPDRSAEVLEKLAELGYVCFGYATPRDGEAKAIAQRQPDEQSPTHWRALAPGEALQLRNNNILAAVNPEQIEQDPGLT